VSKNLKDRVKSGVKKACFYAHVLRKPKKTNYKSFVEKKLDYVGSATDKTNDLFGSRMGDKQSRGVLKRKSQSAHSLLFSKNEDLILKAEAVAISMCKFFV
jgi:hypothetical protein